MINGISRLESGAIVGKVVPSVRKSSAGHHYLIDLERRTSGKGKAQCAWCKWLYFLMIYQAEWRVLPTYMIDRITT